VRRNTLGVSSGQVKSKVENLAKDVERIARSRRVMRAFGSANSMRSVRMPHDRHTSPRNHRSSLVTSSLWIRCGASDFRDFRSNQSRLLGRESQPTVLRALQVIAAPLGAHQTGWRVRVLRE